MRNRCEKLLVCLLAAFFLLAVMPFGAALTAGAQTENVRTVRVAYPIQAGLTEKDENGNYSGYTYEYLEEIAQYTGWNYEFVEVSEDINDSIVALMEMLENGELDLMGAMVYSSELGQQYDYASQNYGTGETVLQVPYNSTQEFTINSKVDQDIRVAVTTTEGMRIKELEDYCRMNLLVPEYILCSDKDEMVEAVSQGRADAFLNSSINYVEGVRTLASFAPKPFYFVTTKGENSQLMEELNSAMRSIGESNPFFATMLFDKYFTSRNTELILTDTEKSYIESCGTLKVGVLENLPPYQYRDEATGELSGISVDLLNYVSEVTGLSFQTVGAENQEDLNRMMDSGEISMVAGMVYNYSLARERSVSMSQPYVSMGYSLIIREEYGKGSLEGKRLAITDSFAGSDFMGGQVLIYPTADDCVKAVAGGEADYTYVDSYTAKYYVNQPHYRSLNIITQSYNPQQTCFGVSKNNKRELLTVLNKVVAIISDEQLQEIVNQNLLWKHHLSLSDYVFQNPFESIAIVSVIAAIIILTLFFSLWRRVRSNRRKSLELKKHYQVYGLVGEYFFEYDFRSQVLMVFIPSKVDSSEPEVKKYKRSELAESDDNSFMEYITTRQSGMQEIQRNCIDGDLHWLRIVWETVFDGNTPVYALGKIHVIDDEKQEKDTLREMAQMDSLTKLYNAEAARALIKTALGHLAPGQKDGMVLVDVDRFKDVNDTYGHLQGDEILKNVAALLRDNVRSVDVVGRPGGDEFVIYLKGIASREMLEVKCAALCEKARELNREGEPRITLSIGAATAGPGVEYDDLYRMADEALYQAKASGRDQYCLAFQED